MFDQFIDFALLTGKSLDNFMHYFRWQPNTSSKASKIVLFDFCAIFGIVKPFGSLSIAFG